MDVTRRNMNVIQYIYIAFVLAFGESEHEASVFRHFEFSWHGVRFCHCLGAMTPVH